MCPVKICGEEAPSRSQNDFPLYLYTPNCGQAKYKIFDLTRDNWGKRVN